MYYKRTYLAKKGRRKIDLHVHTNASDGKYTIDEIIYLANKHHISYLAITDHDTIAGIPDNNVYGNLEIIPGIELSTVLDEQEVHILGFYIDKNEPNLLAEVNILTNARKMRMNQMIEKANDLGFSITIEDVERIAEDGSLGRPHIGLVMVKKGIVNSLDEAFNKYLNRGKPCFVPRYKLSPNRAIQIITAAHGAAVLAHPGLGFPKNNIDDMIKAGLTGIEVYHPSHDMKANQYFLTLAQENDLIITGGSDFHGHNDEDWLYFGNMRVPEDSIKRLKKVSGCM